MLWIRDRSGRSGRRRGSQKPGTAADAAAGGVSLASGDCVRPCAAAAHIAAAVRHAPAAVVTRKGCQNAGALWRDIAIAIVAPEFGIWPEFQRDDTDLAAACKKVETDGDATESAMDGQK